MTGYTRCSAWSGKLRDEQRRRNKGSKVYKRRLFIETSRAGSLSKAESLSGASSFPHFHARFISRAVRVTNAFVYSRCLYRKLPLYASRRSTFPFIISSISRLPAELESDLLRNFRLCASTHTFRFYLHRRANDQRFATSRLSAISFTRDE